VIGSEGTDAAAGGDAGVEAVSVGAVEEGAPGADVFAAGAGGSVGVAAVSVGVDAALGGENGAGDGAGPASVDDAFFESSGDGDDERDLVVDGAGGAVWPLGVVVTGAPFDVVTDGVDVDPAEADFRLSVPSGAAP
jgi:hypothetical protein